MLSVASAMKSEASRNTIGFRFLSFSLKFPSIFAKVFAMIFFYISSLNSIFCVPELELEIASLMPDFMDILIPDTSENRFEVLP